MNLIMPVTRLHHVAKSCRCKKSKCSSRKCRCYSVSLRCTDICQCFECMNGEKDDDHNDEEDDETESDNDDLGE